MTFAPMRKSLSDAKPRLPSALLAWTASRQRLKLAPRLWLTLRMSLAHSEYGGET